MNTLKENIERNSALRQEWRQKQDIAELKHLMTVNDPRGDRENAPDEQCEIWDRSYDELEKLLSDDDFEDFMDVLDGI